jgi:hypothetical protein
MIRSVDRSNEEVAIAPGNASGLLGAPNEVCVFMIDQGSHVAADGIVIVVSAINGHVRPRPN